MSTPVSSATPYCTGSQLVQFYDVRWVGDRLQDAGLRVVGTSVPSDPNLAAILLAVSGLIESRCLRGNKYTPADLQTLTGASVAFLQRLTADLAVWQLLTRRNPSIAIDTLPMACQLALKFLEDLEAGYEIFGLQEKADAGKKWKIFNPLTGQQTPIYDPLSDRTSRFLGDMTL